MKVSEWQLNTKYKGVEWSYSKMYASVFVCIRNTHFTHVAPYMGKKEREKWKKMRATKWERIGDSAKSTRERPRGEDEQLNRSIAKFSKYKKNRWDRKNGQNDANYCCLNCTLEFINMKGRKMF